MMKRILLASVSMLLFAAPAFANNSEIEQAGAEQVATVSQEAAKLAVSKIDQRGEIGNEATVTQAGAGAMLSDIAQVAGYAGQTALVDQTTTYYNEVKIEQGGGEGDEGANDVQAMQAAGGNVLSVSQNVGDDAKGGANSVIATQVGKDNLAKLSQEGDAHKMVITQSGDAGHVDAEQAGDMQMLTLVQDGVGNYSVSKQENGYLTGGNMAVVTQVGDYGYSMLTQIGAENFADLTQTTDGARSTLLQIGYGHKASITQ